jgi:hypothetical protein
MRADRYFRLYCRVAADARAARLFTGAVAAIYGVLGVIGWFVPGLLLGTPVVIPLDPVANVFHLVLAVPALVLVTRRVIFRVSGDQQSDLPIS